MLRAAFIVILLALLPSHALAGGRIALLIGNQVYNAKVGPLKNPRTDVTIVGTALKQLGFQVTILRDADYRTMDTALKRFVAEVRSKGRGAISFFYYSGHGAANPETQINYLIPVDVTDPNDGNLWYQSFQQNDVIDKLSKQAPNATHYVVFDACRNELNLSGPAAKAIGAEKGFVPVPQTPGLLIAYATAQGKTAADVGDNGGPYARALAAELVKPGVEAVSMFRNVQIRVKEDIGQDPWLSFPSLPKVYLAERAEENPATTAPMGASSQPSTPASTEAERAWVMVKDTSDVAALEAFVRRFGDTFYADLAKSRLGELRRVEEVARVKADAERQRLALLQQKDDERRRVEAEAALARVRAEEAEAALARFRSQEEAVDRRMAARETRASTSSDGQTTRVEIYRIASGVSQGIHNMRSGPGVGHNLIVSIPANSTGVSVTTDSCRSPDDGTSTQRWCKAQWRGYSGWVSMGGLVR